MSKRYSNMLNETYSRIYELRYKLFSLNCKFLAVSCMRMDIEIRTFASDYCHNPVQLSSVQCSLNCVGIIIGKYHEPQPSVFDYICTVQSSPKINIGN